MIKPSLAPYKGTTVPAEKTYGQIQRMLLDYGCEAVQITHEASGRVVIRFGIEVETRGVKRRIGIELEPPLLSKEEVRVIPRYSGDRWPEKKKVHVPDHDRSARAAYWYLKSKLEAVSWGYVTAEKEFLSQVMVQLPDGRIGTVGETVDDSFEKGGGLFLPGLSERRFALPAAEERQP